MQVGYIVWVNSITQIYLAIIAVEGGKYINLIKYLVNATLLLLV